MKKMKVKMYFSISIDAKDSKKICFRISVFVFVFFVFMFKQNGHLNKWNKINPNKPTKFPPWDLSLSPNCNNKINMTVLALSCIGVNCVQFVTKEVKTFPLCQWRTTKVPTLTEIQFMFLSRLLQQWVNCSNLKNSDSLVSVQRKF